MHNTTKSIAYIDPEENHLESEVNLAINSTIEDNLKRFIDLIASLAAMSGKNIYTAPKDTRIYYIENGNIE